MTQKSITVFCSANNLEHKYVEPAEKFARMVAESGFDFVWGGSDVGLMKNTSDAAKEAGGKIIGISVEFLKGKAKRNADEMLIAGTLSQRREELLNRGDAVVVMVGGTGTLDETSEVLEHKKHHHHNKPVVFLNTDGFYDGLRTQMERMHSEGFLTGSLDDLLFFADTPKQAMLYLKEQLDQST